MDLPRAIQARKFFVQHPRQQHETICLQIPIAECGDFANCPRVEHSLKHAGNLPASGPVAQPFLWRRMSRNCVRLSCFRPTVFRQNPTPVTSTSRRGVITFFGKMRLARTKGLVLNVLIKLSLAWRKTLYSRITI